MTPKEVLAFCKSKNVQLVDVKFCDFLGTWQHFAMPISELEEEVFEAGLGFDGSSIRGWKSIEASDMLLILDPALAVGTPKRSPSLPDVPTVAESGYPGFDASLWLAIMAPAGTPQPILDRLNREIIALVGAADTREALDKAGAEPLTSTPAELAAMIRDGVPKYAAIVKTAGVKPE